jgi:hypothetical protein
MPCVEGYKNRMIKVITIPASEKYSPFLKAEVWGKNIQKEEITKNNKEAPKNRFNQYTGL